MDIHSTLTTRKGEVLPLVYREDDPLKNLGNKILHGVHAYCFYKRKLVVVYAKNKGYWTPPGGGIEMAETYEEAVVREVFEETNMKVLKQEFIGYQDITQPDGKIIRQTRSFCLVEPYGDFVSDPDGDITEVKLIDPSDYKEYFNWGEVGDRIMQEALRLLGC